LPTRQPLPPHAIEHITPYLLAPIYFIVIVIFRHVIYFISLLRRDFIFHCRRFLTDFAADTLVFRHQDSRFAAADTITIFYASRHAIFERQRAERRRADIRFSPLLPLPPLCRYALFAIFRRCRATPTLIILRQLITSTPLRHFRHYASFVFAEDDTLIALIYSRRHTYADIVTMPPRFRCASR